MKDDINTSMSLVSRIHSASADFLMNEFSKRGLSRFASSHGNILFILSQEASLSMTELASRINRDKSTTTVLVRKLENEGLVKQGASKDDKRSKRISLTAKGKKYNDLTANLSSSLLNTFYAGFSKSEKEQMFSFLVRIAKNFSEESSDIAE